MTQLAYEEAVGHYERALQVLEHLMLHEERRCELLLGLGDALWRMGESLRARENFIHAARIAQQSGAADTLARAALALGEVRAETGIIDDVLIGIVSCARDSWRGWQWRSIFLPLRQNIATH
jgi:tetratricopeptide (TPR) repeat protein